MQQQNYSVGIYVRLSKDDERAGESVSIENQKLHNAEGLLLSATWKAKPLLLEPSLE